MSCVDRFRRDETGSATIEFVLWVPLIVGMLTIVVDAATLYITHSEMWNVARDTARRMVIGSIVTEEQAEQHAVDAMNLRDFPYYVEARYIEGSQVEMIIALSVKDISILGYASPLTLVAGDMMARVVMRPDPRIPFGTGGSGPGGPGGSPSS